MSIKERILVGTILTLGFVGIAVEVYAALTQATN